MIHDGSKNLSSECSASLCGKVIYALLFAGQLLIVFFGAVEMRLFRIICYALPNWRSFAQPKS
jgi:hypothetical protein